jgi:hypothetical protein
MHGDEPSATPALLDAVDFLLRRQDDPSATAVLEGLTLLVVPMLNPDGAEDYVRRNAQGIDVNRDARHLATPEGRLLAELRDRHRPLLGFNLHDQNRRTAVADTGVLATGSVLAVAGDLAQTVTPGRLRAKRASAAVVEALDGFFPGGIARYDEDFNPRAFGDNLTAWGTPVVLIESGGLPAGHPVEDLARLNFVALLRVLEDLARDDLAGHDPALYDALPRNRSDAWVDVAVRGGRVWQPGVPEAYRADLAFNRLEDDRAVAGCAGADPGVSSIVEVGDTGHLTAARALEAPASVVLAPFAAGVEGWEARSWLDGGALAHLARLGVAVVRWAVGAEEAAAAAALARGFDGPGRARLEVVADGAALPWLRLNGPPPVPADGTLAALVTALAGGERAGELLPDGAAPAVLAALWGAEDAGAPPPLRPGAPASFLLVSAAPGGEVDPGTSRLEGIWLDGVAVDPAVP